MALRREDLTAEGFDSFVQNLGLTGDYAVLTPEAREASLRATLDAAPPGDIWLFGYGSLMWNPAVDFAESAIATIHGWHRRFGLWTPLGRGTPEMPGLVLSLDPGGSCRGIAFRLAEASAEEELRLVWRREMISGAYVPRWVSARIRGARVTALTFARNVSHERYAPPLPDADVARRIAGAVGYLGPCHEYLSAAVAILESHGIPDRHLGRLHRMVTAIRK